MQSITLQTSDSSVIESGVLGRLGFAASSESDGADSVLVAAIIEAVAEGNFTQTSNATSLVFSTASSSIAEEKLKITSEGHFVPFASGNYDLGSPSLPFRNLYVDGGYVTAPTGVFETISFNVDNESILSKGEISWSDTEGSLTLGLTDNTTVSVGESRYLRIRNETGGTLYKGQVVYATGVHSNGLITPDLYVADGTIREIRFMGIVLEDVNINNNGYALDFGQIIDIDLDGSASNYAVGDETWVAGDILYVHPTSVGKLTKVEPKHSISVAIVLDPGNGNGNGRMFVRPTSYGHLSDNHDVDVSGVTNGQFLQYDSSTEDWIPSSSGNFTTLQVDGTLVPTGVGTSNYVTKWTDTNSIGDSVIYADNNEVLVTGILNFELEAETISIGDSFSSPSLHLDAAIGDIVFNTNNTQRFRIDNDGNLGVVAKGVQILSDKDTAFGNLLIQDSTSMDSGVGASIVLGGQYNTAGQYARYGLIGAIKENNTTSDTKSSMVFYTNNPNDNPVLNEKVRITSSGNVGIGTALPSVKLDVNGAIKTSSYIQFETTNGYIDGQTADTLTYQADNHRFWNEAKTVEYATFNTSSVVFNDGGLNRDFRIEGSGDPNLLFTDASTDRVGIGQSTLNGKLSIGENSINKNLTYLIHSQANYFQSNNGQYFNWGIYNQSDKYVDPGITDTGYSMSCDLVSRLQGNGTLSATYGLRTYAGIGSSSSSGINTTAYGIQSRVLNAGAINATSSIQEAIGVDIQIDGDLGNRLSISEGITTAKSLRIRSIKDATNKWAVYQEGSSDKNYFAGSVGIGTASPSYKLDVAGSGHFDDNISVGLDPLTNNFGLEIYTDKPHITQRLSDPSGTIINGNWYGNDEVRFASIVHYGPEYSEGSAFHIGPSGSVFASYVADIGIGTLSNDSLIFGTYNIERARINPAGNFGIGTDNPSAKLNVENGNVVFNDLGGTYNFRVEGDADQYLLYVRGSAGADKVGVGTPSLYGKLNAAQTTTNDASEPRTLDVRRNDYTTTNGQYLTFGEVSTCKKYVDTEVTDTGYIIGKDILCYLSDEGTLNASIGIRTYAGLNSESDNGTINYAYGIQPRVINNSSVSGSINTAYGVHVYIDGDLRELGNGGITNAYGVYISDIKYATNSYGVYQDGGLHKNYFAGSVGIGTASPALAGNDKGLHIHATNFPEIKLTNNTTLSTSDDGSVIQVINSEFRFTNREDGNSIAFYAFDTGGVSRQKMVLSEGLIGFNSPQVNTDFQVKGEVDSDLIRTDASTNRVGIGVAVPQAKLHIGSNDSSIRQQSTSSSSAMSHYFYDSPGNLLGGIIAYSNSYSGGSFLGIGASGVGLFSSYSDLAIGTSIGSREVRIGTNNTERVRIDSAGNVGIGTSGPAAKLDIDSNKFRLRTAKTPSSSSDTGNTGDICWDGNYIYVCVSTNTWKRSSLSTW